MDPANLSRTFTEQFGRPPEGMVRSPGRVNLIGEHTDYNDGFVLPIAIGKRTLAAWAPRNDNSLRLVSLQQPDAVVEIPLTGRLSPVEQAWANYPLGVAAGLLDAGVRLVGCDLLYDSDVPLGGGLSSSASLTVATARALLWACGVEMESHRLAAIARQAEHDFAGAPCGIMDPTIVLCGRAGYALLLDCRSGDTRHIPFDAPDAVLLVANTEVRHELSDGGYGARQRQCYDAAEAMGFAALRDADASDLDRAIAQGLLENPQHRRARHVIGEIERTHRAVEALEAADLETFGELMYASHASLRDDFEVSCEELDTIVEAAREDEGVFGARMTGGGFGGCAIVLAETDRACQVIRRIEESFAQRFGRVCPIFQTHAAEGASTIDRLQ